MSVILPARYSDGGGHGKLGKLCCEVMGGPYRHFSQNLDSQHYAEGIGALLHDPSHRSKSYDHGQYCQIVLVGILPIFVHCGREAELSLRPLTLLSVVSNLLSTRTDIEAQNLWISIAQQVLEVYVTKTDVRFSMHLQTFTKLV